MPEAGIVLTGAAGQMGQLLQSALRPSVSLDILSGDDLAAPERSWAAKLAGTTAVVHLAVDPTGTAQAAIRNEAMTWNIIESAIAHDVCKIVFASSVMADPALYGIEQPKLWYGQSKRAQEAALQAWSAHDGRRSAVALRFGLYHPGGRAPSHDIEAVRVTEAGVIYWVRRALAAGPGFFCWTAIGNGSEPGVDSP